MEREWKPNVEMSPACPRCSSSNTKFCYYNNYSLTQPRYFCKGCRRYWTRGGSLRNVPVGGGCRKTRRAIPKSHRDHHPSTTTTTTSSLYSSPISTTPSNASHIDLALVYSNFLNQPPPQHHEETPQLRGDDVVAAESPTICGLDLINVDDNRQQTEGLSQGYFSTGNEDDHSIFMSNYGLLPPLPGEQMVWSNTQTLQVDEPEAQDLCPFDLPDYGAFFRP